MNRSWRRWSKELRRRSIALGAAGIIILAATGLLALFILDNVIL